MIPVLLMMSKPRALTANKETISSVKELSSLLSLMAEIENKIKNLDEEQRSVQQNLKSMYVSKKPEDIYALKDAYHAERIRNQSKGAGNSFEFG